MRGGNVTVMQNDRCGYKILIQLSHIVAHWMDISAQFEATYKINVQIFPRHCRYALVQILLRQARFWIESGSAY